MWFDRQLDDLAINGLLATAPAGQTYYLDNSGVQKPNLKVTPYRTLAQALAQCVSGQGDQIIVAPDHAETLSADLSITKHGVQIIGRQRGLKRPRFTLTTSGTEITISADDVSIIGIDFVSSKTTITNQRILDVAGSRLLISKCRFLNANRTTKYNRPIVTTDVSVTDAACADGDATNPVITSATYTFTSRDVGKVVHVTAGTSWTTGIYTIVSVSAGAATLDRAVGANGALTSGSVSMSVANDVRIEDCEFNNDEASATCAACIQINGTVDRWTIIGCRFASLSTVACIDQNTLLARDLIIVRNEYNNTGTDNVAGGIDLLAGTTGYVDYNDVYHDNGTANTGIDFGGCHLGVNNVISDDIAKKGKAFGTAAS